MVAIAGGKYCASRKGCHYYCCYQQTFIDLCLSLAQVYGAQSQELVLGCFAKVIIAIAYCASCLLRRLHCCFSFYPQIQLSQCRASGKDDLRLCLQVWQKRKAEGLQIHFFTEERHCQNLWFLGRQLEQDFCQKVPCYCCFQRFDGRLSSAPRHLECEFVFYPSVHQTIGPFFSNFQQQCQVAVLYFLLLWTA